MVKNTLYKITGTLFLAAVLMAACVPAQSAGQTSPASTPLPIISITAEPTSTPAPSETPAVTPSDITSSSVSVTGVSPSPLPPTGETPPPYHGQVTLAYNGASITLHVGQTFCSTWATSTIGTPTSPIRRS